MSNFDIEVFLVEEEDVSGSIRTPGLPEADRVKKTHIKKKNIGLRKRIVIFGINVEFPDDSWNPLGGFLHAESELAVR